MRSSSEWKLITTSRPSGHAARPGWRFRRLLQLFELGVDENPKSLKCARRRVLARLAGFDRAEPRAAASSAVLRQGPLLLAGEQQSPLQWSQQTVLRRSSRITSAMLSVPAPCQPLADTLATRGVHAHVQRARRSGS
jgi:hypothetical protein